VVTVFVRKEWPKKHDLPRRCPLRLRRFAPVSMDQSLTVPSRDADASTPLAVSHRRDVMASACAPTNVLHEQVSITRSFALTDKEAGIT